jgi:putative zinc finger/helix-turn-helix YgiT family protein
MKCINCGHAMTTKRENMPYTALPGAILVGVPVSRCSNCGEHEVAIPAIDELNRTLAHAVLRKPGRLNGGEIRFLRSYLAHSGADLARLIGSHPATVSKWENGKQPIGHHADLLLRAMVALDKRVDEYPIETFASIKSNAPSRSHYALRPKANKWQTTEVSARN